MIILLSVSSLKESDYSPRAGMNFGLQHNHQSHDVGAVTLRGRLTQFPSIIAPSVSSKNYIISKAQHLLDRNRTNALDNSLILMTSREWNLRPRLSCSIKLSVFKDQYLQVVKYWAVFNLLEALGTLG